MPQKEQKQLEFDTEDQVLFSLMSLESLTQKGVNGVSKEFKGGEKEIESVFQEQWKVALRKIECFKGISK